jgi:RimJ/RimL family protein N-acetyltransferase
MHLIRHLGPGDLPAFQSHLLGLSQVDRRLRFCGPATDFLIRYYCAEIDWSRSLLYGCFADGRLVGAVHLLWPAAAMPTTVELAVSVDRDYQGRGIGTDLVMRAVKGAHMRGVSSLRFVCHAENEAMQRLALRLGARLVTDGEDMDGTIDVAVLEAARARHAATAVPA